MQLEPNMYVRINTDFRRVCLGIGKIKKIVQEAVYVDMNNNLLISFEKKQINKASYNIIDLIKHKDIILGKDGKLYQCWKVYKDYVFTYSKNKQGQTITLVDYQIDKVLCYEQFESMSYRIGE